MRIADIIAAQDILININSFVHSSAFDKKITHIIWTLPLNPRGIRCTIARHLCNLVTISDRQIDFTSARRSVPRFDRAPVVELSRAPVSGRARLVSYGIDGKLRGRQAWGTGVLVSSCAVRALYCELRRWRKSGRVLRLVKYGNVNGWNCRSYLCCASSSSCMRLRRCGPFSPSIACLLLPLCMAKCEFISWYSTGGRPRPVRSSSNFL